MTEYFIRGSDNQIKLTLTEDDEPILGSWTGIGIYIGSKFIHRTADGDGVAFDTMTGILTITPGDLTVDEQADMALLVPGRQYRTSIVVKSVTNNDGAVFGGAGADPLYFHISDKPMPETSPI